MSIAPKRMRDFCEITSSKRIYASEYVSSGVPFYRSKEVIERQSGKLDVSTEIFISEPRFEEIERKFGAPLKGDLLLTSVGTLGVPYVVAGGERFYFKDGNLTWFRNFKSLDSRYLYYWLLSPVGKAELKRATIGSSQSAYTINLLSDLAITPPDIEKQLRAVQMLSAYDDLIATNQRRIQLLEDAARRLYREWFVHLRFPGYELMAVVDGVPEGWAKMPLGDLAPLNYGKALKATERQDGYVPVYGSSGIVGTHNKALIQKGAIIVGRKGNVGSLYYSPVPCFPIDTVYFILPEHASFLLFLALHQFNFISSDAAVPGLNRNYAHGLQIVWPDAETRSSFEMQAGPMFEQIQNLTAWNNELAKARDLLLPKLMSGQLDMSGIALPEEMAA